MKYYREREDFSASFDFEKERFRIGRCASLEKSNFQFKIDEWIQIEDVSTSGKSWNFNDFGFAFPRILSAIRLDIQEFLTSKMMSTTMAYLEEPRAITQRYIRAEKAICFDFQVNFLLFPKICHISADLSQVRRRTAQEDFDENKQHMRQNPLLPAYKAHAGRSEILARVCVYGCLDNEIDLSPRGGLATLHAHLMAEEFLEMEEGKTRIWIINSVET